MNEVVNGVIGAGDVELAVIPRGTGWDFVRTFDIPRDLDAAIDVALYGAVREIDAGVVTYRTWAGEEARAYFANVGSAGISGAIAQRANESSKALGGKVSYYWATLAVFFGWQAGEMRVTVGDETRSGRMIDAMICNGRFLGGGMMMCPDAEPDDGLFDVLLIGDVTKRDLAFVLPKTYKGKHLPHPRLELLRGSVVTVDADEPLPIELDGEQPGTTPARFEVLPRALRLRVPVEPLGGRLRGRLSAGRRLGLLQRGELLLELRHARLELVDPPHLLREVVDPRPQVVHRGERLLAAR